LGARLADVRNSRGGGWDAAGVSTYEMPAADALELLASFDAHQVHAAVSGGWAIDALLGEQYRPHRPRRLGRGGAAF